MIALADQYAGRSLGFLNPALYELETQTRSGIVDVTRGSNTCHGTFGGLPTCAGVPGFAARPGFDLATGVGTVDAATFVPALVAESQSS